VELQKPEDALACFLAAKKKGRVQDRCVLASTAWARRMLLCARVIKQQRQGDMSVMITGQAHIDWVDQI